MKQVLQNMKTGELEIAEVPVPRVGPGQVLIQTRSSLISSGTERMLVSFAQSNLIGKAKQQPDKVKQVLDKIKTDGLLPTMNSVFARLDDPLPLGYCNCGVVLETGAGVDEFCPGDRVISNGPHAEIICVPRNLCAKVPESVTDEQAAFTVLASIGLQGIRLLQPTYGETVVVTGLGLIGLLCVQMLINCGCHVIGIDLNRKRLDMAKRFGAQVIDVAAGADPVKTAMAYTKNKGVDGVLITASAKDDSIVHESAQMCRKRGRIVLVGVVNLSLDRSDFYEKELTFQVSCSYGPGRYDPLYEQKGTDYPYGFVRWTEQRNFEAILADLAFGRLRVNELISERIPIERARDAYQMLMDNPEKMALILTYSDQVQRENTISIITPVRKISPHSKITAGLIGAGNFAKLTLLPSIKNVSIRLKTVADINGVAGTQVAKKFGFQRSTNDYMKILNDPEINTVFITTRHDLHARMVIEALKAGKHVHVEKPLCLTREELQEIREVYRAHSQQHLLVGFNRRFSPHAQKVRSLLSARSAPVTMSCLINAGYIPADVWIQDMKIGGGRIIGEGCHWLDLMAYIVGRPIVTVSAMMMGRAPGVEVRSDKVSITVCFEDGSIGTLHYFANGHKGYPKEKIEIFSDGRILSLDNFRKLRGYGWSGFFRLSLWRQDKGHRAQFQQFIERISHGGEPLISFEEIENITQASLAAVESAQNSSVVHLNR